MAKLATKPKALQVSEDPKGGSVADEDVEVLGPEITIDELVASGRAFVNRIFRVVPSEELLQPENWPKKVAPILTTKPFIFTILQQHGRNLKHLTSYQGVDVDGVVMHVDYTDGRYKVVEVIKKTKLLTAWQERETRKQELAKLYSNKLYCYSGSDPEMFAVDEKGELIPAFEFLDSKEENPTAYWDGYQAEFTVQHATCLKHHTDFVQESMYALNKALKHRFPLAKLSLKNVFDIPKERLENDEERFVNFGCNPSFNAYGEEPLVIEDPKLVPFRSAGGHLHFSITEDKRQFIPQMVKELDRVLGVISVALFQYYDEPRRRAMYGRAGEYRTPEHGLEYRVLSNAWLVHPACAHLVYEIARVVMGQVVNKVPGTATKYSFWDVTEEEARQVINDVDVEGAKALLKRNEVGLRHLIDCLPAVGKVAARRTGWIDVIMNGVHKYVSNPDEPSYEWGLDGDYSKYWYCMSMSNTPLLRRNSLEQ